MKKFKIGIIGAENSHANYFANLINMPDENGKLRFPDCHISLVYSQYPDVCENFVKEFGVDAIVNSVEEMLQNVDAVMVTARDGKYHYKFVKPFLEAGKPAFIDKPFTVDINETKEIIKIAKKNNIPICGGSSLKFDKNIEELKEFVEKNKENIVGGNLAAPLLIENEYSGFFFYASHLTEMTLEVFGYNPLRISAFKNKNGVCATIEYENYFVTNHFNDKVFQYSATVFSKEETKMEELKLEKIEEKEIYDFVNMLRTGKMTRTYEEYIIPVYYMNAVKESYEKGISVEFEL